MVLVHKLKRVEELDIEQFRDVVAEDGRSTKSDGDEKSSNDSNSGAPIPMKKKRVPSPPRRPLTRSQTGYTSKRRDMEDSVVEKPKTTPPVSKEPKVSRKRPVEEVQVEAEKIEQKHPTPPPAERDDSENPHSVETLPATPTTQITFLESSASGTTLDRRGPRGRATLPVPVPNLTKKSRGRRVPTKTATEEEGAQRETRLYVCTVEDCGKCFHRGEHLKRHIRSIHTHEKPFKCSYPSCYKFFNRHDNLLQHLKVHRDFPSVESPEDALNSGPLQAIQKQPQSASSNLGASFDSAQHPAMTMRVALPSPPPYAAYTTNTLYSSSSSESTGFATNMAISSLRTEIPHSPPLSRNMAHETLGRTLYHSRFDSDGGNEPSVPLLLRQTVAHDWQA